MYRRRISDDAECYTYLHTHKLETSQGMVESFSSPMEIAFGIMLANPTCDNGGTANIRKYSNVVAAMRSVDGAANMTGSFFKPGTHGERCGSTHRSESFVQST